MNQQSNNRRQQQPQPSTALVTRPAPDFSSVPASASSKAVFLPQNLGDAMKLAEFMASGIGVRQWMRNQPSACFAVIQMAMRWGMDPYIVANKSYYTNDTLAFESQLVNAVINTSGELIGRLKIEFEGDATGGVGKETLVCRVSGRLHADPDQVFVHEQPLATVTIRNSPLWKVNPRQQLQYHATRAWARLYMPEVLLGVYSTDEIADGLAQQIEARSTPRDDTPAPDRRSFEQTDTVDATATARTNEETADFEEITPTAGGEQSIEEQIDDEIPSFDKQPAGSDDSVGVGAENIADGDVQPAAEDDSVRAADEVSGGRPGPAVEPSFDGEKLSWREWVVQMKQKIGDAGDADALALVQRDLDPILDDPKTPKKVVDDIEDALSTRRFELTETVK